jgi:predicted 3-demethylubiquinone-9 3-methyltransferase (glyoxalase superfamily)
MATKRKPAARKTTRKASASKPAPRTGATVQAIRPCLWFDSQAEDAARFYVSIFEKARILQVSRYPAVGQEIHGREAGSVMTVEFILDGTTFTALNAGPIFKFSEAISFQVMCRTQAEVDYYWEKLGAGGDPKAQMCGWLKDKFGLSWQIVPEGMARMLKDPKSKGAERAFGAMMQMKKLDIAALEAAFKGK